jgi:hypothetical protein
MRRLYWNRFTKWLFWHWWKFTKRAELRQADQVWQQLTDDQRQEVVYRTLTGA